MTQQVLNKVELSGFVKWEPNIFPGKTDEQRDIMVFAVEQKAAQGDRTSVFHVKVYGDLVDNAKEKNLTQGDHVVIKGRLNESKWKDKKTDEWKNRIEVWCTSLEIGDVIEEDDIPF